MASPNDARQQTATQQQDDNSVVFVDTHLTKLNERKIKSIGLYTESDLAEINQLVVDLHRIFPKQYGLLDRQKLYIRLNGENKTTELTTELNFPETFEDSDRRTRLFLSDLARIIIGLAKTFYAIWQDEELKEFTRNYDELEKLRDWAATGDPEYISEFDLARNAYKIQELLEEVTHVFEKQTGVASESTGSSEATEAPITESGTATVPVVTNTKTAGNAQETEDSGEASSEEKEAEEFANDSAIATEALFVTSAAYQNLITQFLDNAGLAEKDLPPELQQQLAILKDTLRERLFDIIDRLPPEQRQKLLDKTLRLYLYQKLLIELQQDPLFFVTLNQFYQGYARFVFQKSGLSTAEERVAEIERYFATLAADSEIEQQELNQVLEKIRADIRAWKAQVAEEAAKEQEEGTVVEPEQADEDREVHKLPPPQVHFMPNQEAQLEQLLISGGYDGKVRKTVQDQSARVLWGTLAELFKDDVDQLNKLPPAVREKVYSQTLGYILGLSSTELEKLHKSPSSLIRHIKINADRLMGDAAFQHLYNQYTEIKTATVVSRANRVEKETNWAYNQIVFELFSVHNITDPTVPDAPELQGLFDEIKQELYDDVFVFIEEMKTEDLLHLYLHSKDRNEFIREIYKYINADPVLRNKLSTFYHNLIQHYEKTQQFQQRDQLRQSLNNLVQLDAAVFEVRASAPPPQVLFDNAVEKILKTDNKIVVEQSDLVLKSLVVNLGLEGTVNLIQKNRVELLSSVFQIPQGMLNDTNDEEYRAMLTEYARARSSELVATTAGSTEFLSRLQMMYPGLRLDKATTSFTKTATASSTAASQIESVRTVQTVVQANGKDGDEVVAEGTDPQTIKQKRDIVMKIFGSEWNRLSQQDQAAIYIYYGLPFNEQSVKNDINYKLPFVFEYIDFRAKRDYDKLLGKISHEYALHGKKRYNKLLTAGYLEETPSADHIRKMNQLVLAYQAYNFSQLNIEEQRKIAYQAGYDSIDAFLKENTILSQNALSNNPELNQIIQQMNYIDDLLPQIALEAEVANQALVENLNAGEVITPEALVAIPAAAAGVAGAAASPQASVLNTLRQMVGSKVKKEALKKGGLALAAKAGLGAATGGLATVLSFGVSLLQDRRFRELAIFGGTALISSLLYALSTIGGLAGSLLGGSFGFLTAGPVGALGGGALGAYTGAAVFPQQWGNWFGFSPRQAPGLESLYPENNATLADASMRAARAGGAQTPAAAAAATNSALTGGTTAINAAPAAPAAITAATTSTTAAATAGAAHAAAAAGGVSTGLWGMAIGLAAPTIAMVSVFALTTITILVITGAFLVPVPTRDSNWKGDPNAPNTEKVESKFLDLEKTASITQIENGVDTPVTYTIKVAPKNGYTIKITGATDEFTKSSKGGPELVSGITEASFPQDPITDPVEVSYTVNVGKGLTDTRVTNILTLNFEAINRNGYTEERFGSFKTTASVKVGHPVEGCWPVGGTITQLPYNPSYTHGCPRNPLGNRFCEDAYDIVTGTGEPIYSPYAGNACRQPFDAGGFGNWVSLTVDMNGTTFLFYFAHMQQTNIKGDNQCQQVQAGDILGFVDSTGNSDVSHLHYELAHKTSTNNLQLVDLVPHEDGVPSLQESVSACN